MGSIRLDDFIDMKTIDRFTEAVNRLVNSSLKSYFRLTGEKLLRSSIFCWAESSEFSLANFFWRHIIVIRVDKHSWWNFKCRLCSSEPTKSCSNILTLRQAKNYEHLKNIRKIFNRGIIWKKNAILSFKFLLKTVMLVNIIQLKDIFIRRWASLK